MESKGKVGAGTTILGSSAQNKLTEPSKSRQSQQEEEEEEEDDDYDNDPWEMDGGDRKSNSNGKKQAAAMNQPDKRELAKPLNLAPPAATTANAKKEQDNGLIVDNDFGDDFDEDEDEEEEEEEPALKKKDSKKEEDIFERQLSNEQ